MEEEGFHLRNSLKGDWMRASDALSGFFICLIKIHSFMLKLSLDQLSRCDQF